MKHKGDRIQTVYSLIWGIFYQEQEFLTRTNYCAINVESTLIRIYDI